MPVTQKNKLYVAIGIDCDPDRDTYPEKMTFRGIENIPKLFDLPDIKWTFNIRADSEVRDYHGSAHYCYQQYREIWETVLRHGSAWAWHLHYYDNHNRQDISETNIVENIRLGSEALNHPDLVHMGWTFQNEFSIRRLYEAGVRVDYSPLPKMKFDGRRGTDMYDWGNVSYEPYIWHGVKMIPAYTFKSRLLAHRFGTERVMLTTCTTPLLFKMLVRDFFKNSHAQFFVNYFHIDEIISALRDWRRKLYSFDNLKKNIEYIKIMADRNNREIEFVNIRQLAGILFDENNPGHQ
nr:hypothetical protein [candidate division Zixibacteria bacterium]